MKGKSDNLGANNRIYIPQPGKSIVKNDHLIEVQLFTFDCRVVYDNICGKIMEDVFSALNRKR